MKIRGRAKIRGVGRGGEEVVVRDAKICTERAQEGWEKDVLIKPMFNGLKHALERRCCQRQRGWTLCRRDDHFNFYLYRNETEIGKT